MKMRLEYEGKKELSEFYNEIPSIKIGRKKKEKINKLFYG